MILDTWTMPRRLNAAEVPLHWVLYLGWADRFCTLNITSKYLNVPRFLEMCNLIYWCVSIYIIFNIRCILHQFAWIFAWYELHWVASWECKPSTNFAGYDEAPWGPLGPPWSDPSMPESDGTMDDSWWLNISDRHSNTLEVPRHPQMVMDSNILKWSRRWSEVRDVMFPSHSPFCIPPVAFRHRPWPWMGVCDRASLTHTRFWQSVSLRHIKECMLNISLQSTEASWGDAKDCETMLDMRQVML